MFHFLSLVNLTHKPKKESQNKTESDLDTKYLWRNKNLWWKDFFFLSFKTQHSSLSGRSNTTVYILLKFKRKH